MKNRGGFTIFVDFDGTLIKENFLMEWVLFLIKRSGFPMKWKLFFMLKSFSRGAISMAASRHMLLSEWSVRIAYRTFEGISIRTVDEFVNYKTNGNYLINLNRNVLDILLTCVDYIRDTYLVDPEVVIYSQGSFEYAIRSFLNRVTLMNELHLNKFVYAYICRSSIKANKLEVISGKLTGEIEDDIVTKFKRITELYAYPNEFLFIGDDKDEAIIKSFNIMDGRILNHRRLAAHSMESVLTDLFRANPSPAA